MDESLFRRFFERIKKSKNILIVVIVPCITALLPIFIKTEAAKCAFVVILMGVFWITEALPICITALLPLLFYPILGIISADKVAPLYFKDSVALFLGGISVANAIEITNLHKRFALFVLLKVGSEPKWIMLGFMLITAFLSLWIVNTATAAMMFPVVEAVVKELNEHDAQYFKEQLKFKSTDLAFKTNEAREDVSEVSKELVDVEIGSSFIEKSSIEIEISNRERKQTVGFLLCCAYAVAIGGMGSVVGTAANILLKGYFDENYPGAKLTFLNYMLFSLPISIIMLILSWIWLVIRWLPRKNLFKCKTKTKSDDEFAQRLKSILEERYQNLGPMSWAEANVAFVFILLAILWITRDLHFIPGWGFFFRSKFISDSTPAILALFLLFILPGENIFVGKPYKPLIEWKILQQKFPWDIFLLLGGGLAMAEGFQKSGLSVWFGSLLKRFANRNKLVLLIVIELAASLATEFTSNLSIVAVFLPIIDTLAKETGNHPTFLLIPMVVSANLAFMLPVASPTNAIIFSSGKLRIIDMITTGFIINTIGLGVIFLASNTWLDLIFNVNLNTSLMMNATTISTN